MTDDPIDVEDTTEAAEYDPIALATEAARYGLSVFPVRYAPGERDDKSPMPGYGWRAQATSRVNEVVEDFEHAAKLWGYDNVMVAWAIGGDGFVAIDVDDIQNTPPWMAELEPGAVINHTRKGYHLVHRFPEGIEPGNGEGGFPSRGWGEVRGAGGYVVVRGPDRDGLDPSTLGEAKPFPRPEWLTPYGGGADSVSMAEAHQFAERHTGSTNLAKLDAIRQACDNWSAADAGNPERGRHPFGVWLFTLIASEAAEGHYPYRDALKVATDWWQRVTPPERHGRELAGLVTWGIGRALTVATGTAELPPEPERLPLFVGWDFTFPDPEPLIEDVLDLGTVGTLFARWGCYKSFLALDMALHVATGRPWWGKEVRQMPVAILGYEAPASLHRRSHAWGRYYAAAPEVGFYNLAHRGLPKLSNASGIMEVRELLDEMGVGLVVVDTIARAGSGVDMNGDEANHVIDGLMALGSADRTVLGVGHAGKDVGRGLRGWSGLEDAMDFLLTLDRERDEGNQPIGPATLSGVKAKDRDSSLRMLFDLDTNQNSREGDAVLVQTSAGRPLEVVETSADEVAAAMAVVRAFCLQRPEGSHPVAVLASSCERPDLQNHVVRLAIEQLMEAEFLVPAVGNEPSIVRVSPEFLELEA